MAQYGRQLVFVQRLQQAVAQYDSAVVERNSVGRQRLGAENSEIPALRLDRCEGARQRRRFAAGKWSRANPTGDDPRSAPSGNGAESGGDDDGGGDCDRAADCRADRDDPAEDEYGER